MAMRVTVRFGETDHVIPMLNIGQIERLNEIIEGIGDDKLVGSRKMFLILPIILEDASPPVGDVPNLRATIQQVQSAIQSVFVLSGLSGGEPGTTSVVPAPEGEGSAAAG